MWVLGLVSRASSCGVRETEEVRVAATYALLHILCLVHPEVQSPEHDSPLWVPSMSLIYSVIGTHVH